MNFQIYFGHKRFKRDIPSFINIHLYFIIIIYGFKNEFAMELQSFF